MSISVNGDERLGQIVPKTRVEQVREAILAGILSGIFPPGHRLIESVIAKKLGVSQSTVNQALQDLHAQAIVSKSLNKGTTVAHFGPDDLEQLFTVRTVIEVMAGEAVARRMTPELAAELRVHVDAMRSAASGSDVPGFYLADYEFHQNLYRMTGNPFLIQAAQAVAAAPFVFILCGTGSELPMNYHHVGEDHEEIIQALLAGPVHTRHLIEIKLEKWLKSQVVFLRGQGAQS